MKSITFVGSSLRSLRDFPPAARREAGYQLDRIQTGEEPTDWRPMQIIGAGVREVRIRDDTGAFRVIYLASFPETIYVLHAFQKKTQATERKDVALSKARYFHVLARRRSL